MKTHNLGATDPYGAEESAIANRQRLAELLMQSSATGPTYSKGAAFAKALGVALATKGMHDADKERIALAQRRDAEQQAEMGRIMDAAENPGRAQLARLLVASRDPTLRQSGLGMLLKGPAKLERVDMGDRIGLLDEQGNVVREMPKGVSPDTRYNRETVSADKRFDKETVGAEALLTDERTRSEGAANRGVTIRGQNITDSRTRAEGEANRGVTIRGQDITARGQDMQNERAREAAAAKPPTEGERSAGGYASRMEAAEQLLGKVKPGDQKPGVRETVMTAGGGDLGEMTANALPGFMGGRSDARQSALQAQRDWVRAKLRKESGAVIGAQEMADEIRTYFPQIGDSDAVIQQKAAARAQALEAMRMGAGRAASQTAPKGPARVTSDADFDALPSGAEFIGPDGKLRRKP